VEKLLYSITEAGELIGRRKSTAYAMAAAGELETVVVGSQRMVPADALRSYL
jgi:excisionase family DNA binding protein